MEKKQEMNVFKEERDESVCQEIKHLQKCQHWNEEGADLISSWEIEGVVIREPGLEGDTRCARRYVC